jgi:hypothetical protein
VTIEVGATGDATASRPTADLDLRAPDGSLIATVPGAGGRDGHPRRVRPQPGDRQRGHRDDAGGHAAGVAAETVDRDVGPGRAATRPKGSRHRRPTEGGPAMRQLVYALRFTGRATPASPDGGVLTVVATAPSATLTAIVGPAGLADRIEPVAGGEAEFASQLTLTGETSFQEVGTIAFGAGHRLRFATVGSGYLGPGPDPGRRHGAAVWRVEGGEGQFAGARGLITADVVLGEDLAVVGHHLGVIFLR